MKMELQVESSQEGGMDDAALDEGDGETVINEDCVDFDDALNISHQVEGVGAGEYLTKRCQDVLL